MKLNKTFLFLSIFLFAPIGAVFAEVSGEAVSAYRDIGLAIGAALSISLAALGGGLGQGRVAASALEGIARNPGASGKIFMPMIIGLALIESLVIYALLIALFLFFKL